MSGVGEFVVTDSKFVLDTDGQGINIHLPCLIGADAAGAEELCEGDRQVSRRNE